MTYVQQLSQRIELMEAAVPSRLSPPHQFYKHDFNNNVRKEPTISVRDYVFIDRLQLAATLSGAANEMRK